MEKKAVKELEEAVKEIQNLMEKYGLGNNISIVISKRGYSVYDTLHFETK